MLFIDNKYTRIYYEIIEQARFRSLPDDVYTECHHIIPQSFYKSRSKTGGEPSMKRWHFDNCKYINR